MKTDDTRFLEKEFSRGILFQYACHGFSLLSLQGALAYGIGLWLAYDYLIEFFELAYDWLMGCLPSRLGRARVPWRWPSCRGAAERTPAARERQRAEHTIRLV